MLRSDDRLVRPAIAAVASLVLALVVAGFLLPARAGADIGAAGFLSAFSERALARLTEPGISEREQARRFHDLVNEGFDIPAIGRFVLGRYWAGAGEAKQSAFLGLFVDLIVHRFQPLFGEYAGERLVVGNARPFSNNPDFLSVSSQIASEAGEPVRVQFRVRRVESGYKIVDVVAEGVSIAVTLRSEYGSVLKRNGGDVGDLVRVLRGKISRL
jgi:phospholipid transport system substrate-binding protein